MRAIAPSEPKITPHPPKPQTTSNNNEVSTMSQRDGFTGGFLLGTLVGGVIGGVVGALAASQRWSEDDPNPNELEGSEAGDGNIEGARRSLESKISQLNLAIDDVRQQLGSVNGSSSES